ncbi:hypothetical protein REPUB_Repub06bG0076400 [Reevesia pubescens]
MFFDRSREKVNEPFESHTVVSYKDSLLGGSYGSFTEISILAGLIEDHNLVDEPTHEDCFESELCVNLNLDEKNKNKAKMGTLVYCEIVVWVRLPELPVEYFDVETLKKIGKKIETLLRFDGHTLAGEKGRIIALTLPSLVTIDILRLCPPPPLITIPLAIKSNHCIASRHSKAAYAKVLASFSSTEPEKDVANGINENFGP